MGAPVCGAQEPILSAIPPTPVVDISPQARELHFSSLVVDTHVDTTQRLIYDQDFDFGARNPDGSVDIPRLREGGIGAVFFAVWTPGSVTGNAAVERAAAQIDAIHRLIPAHPKDLSLAKSVDDIRAAHAEGRIAILIAIEGGHLINHSLRVLRKYHQFGARYMTLTHSLNVEWADSSTDQLAHNGLTEFGREVIVEMNQLGMMVDVSHVSDKTFADVLEISTAPVIATHSSCRARCDSPRNLTDAMIRALAAKRGLIQINFHMGFLGGAFREAYKANPSSRRRSIPASPNSAETISPARCAKPRALRANSSPKENFPASTGPKFSTTSITWFSSSAPIMPVSAPISTAPTCPSAWRTPRNFRKSPMVC